MVIETKHNPGDRVWAIIDNRAQCVRIESVAVQTTKELFNDAGELVSFTYKCSYYVGDGYWVRESECFPTKEELLKSL